MKERERRGARGRDRGQRKDEGKNKGREREIKRGEGRWVARGERQIQMWGR